MNRISPIACSPHEQWESNGWARVPSMVGTDELAAWRTEAERLWADQSHFGVRGAVPQSATRSDRLDPFIDLSRPFADLARDPRMLDLVGGFLGGRPQLMKDKMIFKPAGAGGYGAHQDGAYWQDMGIDLSRFLTAFLFLDEATQENGAVECTSGQHRGLLTEPGVIADPAEEQLDEFTTIVAAAGDLLLIHALTPHRSGPNRSGAMRRALAFTYGVDARPDLYSLYQRHRQGNRN